MRTTRVEIASIVGSAFAKGPLDKSELLTTAVAAKAPPAVIETLSSLPETRFTSMREIWPHLHNVPVDA